MIIKRPVLLYDGECNLCIRFKTMLERIEGTSHITMLSIYDPDVPIHFPELSLEQLTEKVHLIDEFEKVHVGGEVISYLAPKIPIVKNFAWLLESEAGKKTRDFFYDAISRYRNSLLNPCSSCKNKDK